MHHTILNEMDGLLFSFPILPQFLSCWGNLIFAVSVKGPNTSTQLQADVYTYLHAQLSPALWLVTTRLLSRLSVYSYPVSIYAAILAPIQSLTLTTSESIIRQAWFEV